MAPAIPGDIPEATVARLPVYLRALQDLADENLGTVSSERLAEMAGVNAAKVRKDLSHFGSYGTRGVGYDVEYLLFHIRRELGLTHDWHCVIAGMGNLGQALANYGGFGERGFPVAALVDADRRKVGVEVETVRSGPLKAEPSPFAPATPAGLAVIGSIVQDSYDWFVDIVAERRGLERDDALVLADGRIFTGRQALDAKLIDEIGAEEEALAWLAKKGVDKRLPIRDWKPADRSSGFFSSDVALLWIARQLGIGPDIAGGGIADTLLRERLKLDGLMSVWQGPGVGDQLPAEGARE